MLPAVGEIRPWADPNVVQINRLAMHVPLAGFDRRSLDGRWSLELFDSPDAVPADALEGERPNAAAVAVPGNWTIQDLSSPSGSVFVDTPHYTNTQMPFGGPPPRLPERNPTGVYRRPFTVPASWMEHRAVLHVAGAESVHAVYVNGRFVGYGTDSRLPSEYDVGPFLVPDRNELAIMVARYSAHSYIEDQDQWWMAGLHRSVWIESRPNVHLADLACRHLLRPDHRGRDGGRHCRGRLRRGSGAGLVGASHAAGPLQRASGRHDPSAGSARARPARRVHGLRGGRSLGCRPCRGVERRDADAVLGDRGVARSGWTRAPR